MNIGFDMKKKEKELSVEEKILLQKELIELTSRATGRSTHILNEIINDFFEYSIGTPIEIYDHYEYEGYDKDKKIRKVIDSFELHIKDLLIAYKFDEISKRKESLNKDFV